MGCKVCLGAKAGARGGEWRFCERDYEGETAEVQGGGGSREDCEVRVFVVLQVATSCCMSLTKGYRYNGYNESMINRFVLMGFDLDRVVAAFDYVGIDTNDGEDYPLEEAYIGDITARLLGEP